MHSRRRRHKNKSSNVELNLAAMLDMAFQLLTFFILTFRPTPVEGQLGLHLPPPVAVTQQPQNQAENDKGNQEAEMADVETLDLQVVSDAQGEVSQIKTGFRPLIKGRLNRPNLDSLNEQLKTMFKAQAIPLDRVQLVVDERLRYEELMKIVDICTKQVLSDGKNLQRISFIPMKPPGT